MAKKREDLLSTHKKLGICNCDLANLRHLRNCDSGISPIICGLAIYKLKKKISTPTFVRETVRIFSPIKGRARAGDSPIRYRKDKQRIHSHYINLK
jgi:hypothetical protein